MTPFSPGRARRALTFSLLLFLPAAGWAAAGAGTSDAAVAFAYGLAALNRGDAEAAVAELAEAVRLDPDDGTARYFLGLALLRSGDRQRAAVELSAALSARRPARVERLRIEEDLSRARGAAPGRERPLPLLLAEEALVLAPTRRLSARAGLAFGSDSNPALLADGALYIAPDGTVVEKASASVAGASLALTLQGRRGDEAGPVGLTLEAGEERWSDLDFLDLRYGRLVASLALAGDPAGYVRGPLGLARTPRGRGRLSLLVQAGGSYAQVDGESSLRAWEAGASLGLRHRRSASHLELTYRDLDYSGDRTDDFRRSGGEVTLGLAETFYLGAEDRYLRLFVRAGERDAGRALDADRLEAGGSLYAVLSPRVALRGEAAWRREDFQDPASNPYSFGGDPREDSSLRAAGAASFAVTPQLIVTLRASWAERDARLAGADLDYDRTTAALALTWIF